MYAVRIQEDGKIVVAGPAAYFGRNSRFALARLTSDGSLDPTFGGDGTVVTDVTPSYDALNGMALQPNGKIVVVGGVSAGPDNGKIGVLRYRSDGSLDPAFGGDGIVRADPTPTYDDGFAIGVEADGQIIVAGGAGFDGPNERFVVLAFEPDGSLDPTFGGDGKVFTDLTPKTDLPFALAIQDDGKIVVAGGAAQDGPDPKFALVRYERDGSLDPSFKGDGTVITNVTPHADVAYSVAIDPDGRIVAAGLAGDGGPAPRFGGRALPRRWDAGLRPSAVTARSPRTSRGLRLGVERRDPGRRLGRVLRHGRSRWAAPVVRGAAVPAVAVEPSSAVLSSVVSR